ncbi:MAG: MotA/TolQ/ExbB proton channel family protein [Myxococcota bacterium]
MDISTVIGLIAGIGLILAAIMMDASIMTFVNAPGLMVVVGGTVAAVMIGETLPNLIGAFKVGLKAVINKAPAPLATIDVVGQLATAARKDGILALESIEIEDDFLAKGVRMAVDGIAPEEIKAGLAGEVTAMRQRHKRGQKLFRGIAATAPSMGMIGTLIGLVQMLQQLDDPSAIGPAMAIALLTTLYGAIIAFLMAGPVADKLEHRTSEEMLNMQIILEGVEGILKGENPRLIQEKLEGFLAPKFRSSKDA